MSKLTPMMKQYLDIKEGHKDAILFYRLGDFYEMFFDDAVEASKILEITLTTRNKNDDVPVPLCGIPYHAASSYIAKLIDAGKKVAICEQVEDPKTAKGVVKREVMRVVTPGVIIDEGNLNSRENNYLASLNLFEGKAGLSYIDISTGDFRATEVDIDGGVFGRIFTEELSKIEPKELIVSDNLRSSDEFGEMTSFLSCPVSWLEDECFNVDSSREMILSQFDINSLDGLGCSDMPAAIGASGAILSYLNKTQGEGLPHVDILKVYHLSSFMVIDAITKRNLELTSTMYDSNKKGSLYNVLDFTETAMGGRKLKEWINYPLQSVIDINKRLDGIAELKEFQSLRGEIKKILSSLYDVERLNVRISAGRASPRDMVALRNSLAELPGLKDCLKEFSSDIIGLLECRIDCMPDLEALIANAIEDDPPVNIKDGGIILRGYDSTLDELREISGAGKGYLAKMEAEERTKTGINSLKVRYNKVFGYYIEVTKTNLSMVPDYYIRKQTLTNAERYITSELKEYESKILGADEKILELEYNLFTDIRDKAAKFAPDLKSTADALAELDVMVSLAEAASKYGYSRPQIDNSEKMIIEEGRHPVVEQLHPDEPFVPNDTDLDCEESRMAIITGPNMAGKSTYIRQVALISLMAHMGSFVPAESALIGLVDRIFTRVGASDNLATGQSTFMVEMNETANILNNATRRSLIILDEIGRGTSTFDGVSIAWAVAEYIHDSPSLGARTLFATHYHELTELALTKSGVRNYNVAVKEWDKRIIFLRKIIEGGASRSYGIEVARLAGLPKEVIARSLEILNNLEKGEFDEVGMPKIAMTRGVDKKADYEENQMNLFRHPSEHVFEEIRSIDISEMTPIEALNRLSRFKEEIN